MGPYQRTPKSGDRAIRYSGLGVRSVGPVGDFLEFKYYCIPMPKNIFHMFWFHIKPVLIFFFVSMIFHPTKAKFLRSISEVAIPKDNIWEGILAITLADMFHCFKRRGGKGYEPSVG